MKKILTNGWFIFACALIGIYLGLYQKQYVPIVATIGSIYLNVLTMCILPILLTTISVNIARLLHSSDKNSYISRMLIVFIAAIFISSSLGVAIGLWTEPGAGYTQSSLNNLGTIVKNANAADLEIAAYTPYIESKKHNVIETFLESLIPSNIFSALNTGSSLKVLFFAIFFGLAIGTINQTISQPLLSSLETAYMAFNKIVQWLMLILPFGLLGLIANDIAKVGLDALNAMMQFVPIALLSFGLILAISCLILWKTTGSIIKPFLALKNTMVISLGTGNALASLPSAMHALNEELGYERKDTDLLMPLAITFCRTGPTIYFALSAMFVAQLYHVELGLTGLATVVIGSVFAGLATAGSSGVVLLSMLSMVLIPLNLPVEAVLVLFIVIDPIIGPFRVLSMVFAACAMSTLILANKNSSKISTPLEATP
jgi:proton glutamate symport protein